MKFPSESGSFCRLQHSDLRLWRPLKLPNQSGNVYKKERVCEKEPPLRSGPWRPVKFPVKYVSVSRVEHPYTSRL